MNNQKLAIYPIKVDLQRLVNRKKINTETSPNNRDIFQNRKRIATLSPPSPARLEQIQQLLSMSASSPMEPYRWKAQEEKELRKIKAYIQPHKITSQLSQPCTEKSRPVGHQHQPQQIVIIRDFFQQKSNRIQKEQYKNSIRLRLRQNQSPLPQKKQSILPSAKLPEAAGLNTKSSENKLAKLISLPKIYNSNPQKTAQIESRLLNLSQSLIKLTNDAPHKTLLKNYQPTPWTPSHNTKDNFYP